MAPDGPNFARSAVVNMADLSSSNVRVGRALSKSAITPEMCGVAMLVPDL